ncbi:MAG TPA: gamma-glutamylcyclotransferase family protein [Hyphomicrobiaceae bacterium]|nr:gamma-glutamylcyclotransferase family protein [Hyphomicrobiaceae bacterium]
MTHLFVYGSLLSAVRHPMGERLRREATLVGPASMRGRLYRIASYPGLVEGGGLNARVYGELYALAHPDRTFKWLDAYEGIRPGNAGSNEYERVERAVQRDSGGAAKAWVYLYLGDVSRLVLVAGGRWTARARQ